MRTFIFSLMAVAALAFVAGNSGQARASWLSEALHRALDRNQLVPYYEPPPAYPYPGPYPGDYTPVDPYAPGYGYPYPPYYYYGPDYRGDYWPGYHRDWRYDPRWRHHGEWERHGHDHHH